MDPQVLLSFLLEHIKEQTGILRSMKEEQTGYMKQQTSMNEQHTRLLTSINEHLAKLNACNLQDKVEDEDHVKNAKREQKVTKINEEVMCDSNNVKQLHESLAPWPLSSRTEERKYRLYIVGKVCHEEITDENGRLKMNIFRGRTIPRIEVILKHGDEQVAASHHLASLTVELVILDAKCYIEDSTDYWPEKAFKDYLMPVSNNSEKRMTVERGIFSLDGGRKVCTVASINQSSCKQKVKLGVMVVQNGSVQERVLEGVSSNEFYVIHERRRDATCANKDSKRQATGNSELNSNGKRVNSDTALQPRTLYSQCSVDAQSPQKFGQHATDAGYIGGAVPSQSYTPYSNQGLPASSSGPRAGLEPGQISTDQAHMYTYVHPELDHTRLYNKFSTCGSDGARADAQGRRALGPPLPARVHKQRLDDNNGIPSEEAYVGMPNPPDSQGHVDLSSRNLMMGKRIQIDTTLQPSASYSQHGRNMGRAVPPRAYNAPYSYQGLPNPFQTRFDDTHTHGIPSKQAYGFVPNPPNNLGHVDPSQNLMMGPPVEARPTPNMLGEVNGNGGTLGCAEGPPIEARPIPHMLGKVTGPPVEGHPIQDMLEKVTGNAGTLSCAEAEARPIPDMLARVTGKGRTLSCAEVDAHRIPNMLGKVTGNTRTLNCAEGSDLVIDLSLATQPQLTNNRLTRQPGNNGTGGGQGQPSIPQSNNLHTNSQGHIVTTAATTNDFTSAMYINSTRDDLDVETGGHEHGGGGRVGNDDHGGGNDGGLVGDKDGDVLWDELFNIFPNLPN